MKARGEEDPAEYSRTIHSKSFASRIRLFAGGRPISPERKEWLKGGLGDENLSDCPDISGQITEKSLDALLLNFLRISQGHLWDPV